jgi:hypothetical protein
MERVLAPDVRNGKDLEYIPGKSGWKAKGLLTP